MFHKILLLGLIGSLSTSFAFGKPEQVIIIRHGEKPEQGEDLTQKGRERAAALAPFFMEGSQTPVAIYALSPNDDHHSRRSVETVAPLAHEMKLDLKTFHKDQIAEMAKEILSKPEYDGKVVLICWSHKAIPKVAGALGIANPPAWQGHVFDRLWIIKFNDGQAKLESLSQRLLYGDSAD